MHYLAVIPARGGSKGIPKKNIAPVAGKPLIAWTIEAALQSKKIQKVVVSTDDNEIAQVARKFGAEVPFMRPNELALDQTPSLPVIQHAFEFYKKAGFNAEAVLTLQPTSPLRNAQHLDEAMRIFEHHSNADSLVSIVKVPHHMGPESLMHADGPWVMPNSKNSIIRRQDKPVHWCRNGAAIYITKADALSKFIWGGMTLGYEMDKLSSIDIDDEKDLFLADALLTRLFKVTDSKEIFNP